MCRLSKKSQQKKNLSIKNRMINDGFFMGANQKPQKNSKKSENTDKKKSMKMKYTKHVNFHETFLFKLIVNHPIFTELFLKKKIK